MLPISRWDPETKQFSSGKIPEEEEEEEEEGDHMQLAAGQSGAYDDSGLWQPPGAHMMRQRRRREDYEEWPSRLMTGYVWRNERKDNKGFIMHADFCHGAPEDLHTI